MDRKSTVGRASIDGICAPERRNRQDRRRHGWRTIAYGLRGRGRRRSLRRRGQNYYLDWYAPNLVVTGLAVLMMSSLDALFTLALLGRGAYEANYLMAQLLEVSDQAFISGKVAMTASGVVFLLMHAHFRVGGLVSGKHLLQLMVLVYGLLIVYEIWLLGVQV